MASWLAASALTVAEADGTPSVSGVNTILVSNTTLTDNGSGSVSMSMTPAGGANTALSNLASVAINAALATGAGTTAALTATALAAIATTQAGIPATLTASAATAGSSTTGAAAGGSVTITSGAAASKTSGDANGGDIIFAAGAGTGAGTRGILRASADNVLALGSIAYRFTTAYASTGFSIYKAASEANPTATLGNGVLNFGAGTTNAVDVGICRSSSSALKITDGGSGEGHLTANRIYSTGYISCSGTLYFDALYDVALYRSSAGVLKVTDGSTGSGSIAATSITRVAATSDAATDSLVVKSGDAFPGAATNVTGANTILAGGIGKRIFTVVDYTQLAGTTVTITVNGTATVKTENVDWFDTTSNGATAISLASAIDGITGVSASAATNDVRIVPDAGTYSLTIAKTAADAGMTATSGTNGAILLSLTDPTYPGVLLKTDNSSRLAFRNATDTDYCTIMGLQVHASSYVVTNTIYNSSFDANMQVAPGLWTFYASGTNPGNVVAGSNITAVGTAAYNGVIRTGVYKRAWTNAEVVALGAVDDAELKIATLPAKTIVRNAYVVVDTRETHLTDLTVALGRTGPTYIDYIVASDADVSAESLGSELVTNGTFTTNANGWTLGGAGGAPDWHFDTDHVDRDTGGGTGTLTPSTPLVAVIGTQYKLQWTMAGFSAGTCTASFGGVSGAARGSDATFTEYFTATSTATLAFTPTNDFVGSVDTVILKEVARTVYGDLVTERGTNLTGYDLPSYTTTTDVYLNFVTTDGGHDLTNALQSTGTVYLMTETLP